jgi:hypothetical protein
MWGLVKKRLSISKKSLDDDENEDKVNIKSNTTTTNDNINNNNNNPLISPNKSIDMSSVVSSVQQRSIKITFPKDKSLIPTEDDIRLQLAEYGQINNIGIKEKHAVVLFLNAEDAYFCNSNINKIFGSEFKGKYMGSMFTDLTNTSRLNNLNDISQIENNEIPLDNNSSNKSTNGEGIILTEVLNDQSSIFLDEHINDELGITISNSFNINTSIQNNDINNNGRRSVKAGLKLDNGISFNESNILFAQSPTSQMMMSHHNDDVDEYEEEEEEDISHQLDLDNTAGVETMEGFETSENDVSIIRNNSIQFNKLDKRGSISLYDIEDSNSNDGSNNEDDDNNNLETINESNLRLRSFTQIDITRNEINNIDEDGDNEGEEKETINEKNVENSLIDSTDTSLVAKLFKKTTTHQANHQIFHEIPNNDYQSDDNSTSTLSSSSKNQWKVAKQLTSPVKSDVTSSTNSSLLATSLSNSSTSQVELMDDNQHKIFYQKHIEVTNDNVTNDNVTDFDEIENEFESNKEEDEVDETSAVISVTTRHPRTIVVGLKSPESKVIDSTSIQQIDDDNDKSTNSLDLSYDDKTNSPNTSINYTSIKNLKVNISPEKSKFPENNTSSIKYKNSSNVSQELVFNTSKVTNNSSNLISNSSNQYKDWPTNENSSYNKSQLNLTKQISKPPLVTMSPTEFLESQSNDSQTSQIKTNNSINNINYTIDSIDKSQTENNIKNNTINNETILSLKLEKENNIILLEKIKILEDEIMISKAVARVRERERLDYEKEAKKCEEDWATELTALSIRNLSLEKELFNQKELVMKMKIDSVTKDAQISSLMVSKDNAELKVDGAKGKAERDSLSAVLSQKKLVEILDNQRISVENQTQLLKSELNTLRTDYTKVVEESLQWKQEVIKLKQEVSHIEQEAINDIVIEKINEKDNNTNENRPLENHLFESFSASTRKLVNNETNKYLGHLTPSVKRIDNLISPTTTQSSILNSSLKSPQNVSINHVNFNQSNEDAQEDRIEDSNNYQENQQKEERKEIELLPNGDEKNKNIENIQENIINSESIVIVENSNYSKKTNVSQLFINIFINNNLLIYYFYIFNYR